MDTFLSKMNFDNRAIVYKYHKYSCYLFVYKKNKIYLCKEIYP